MVATSSGCMSRSCGRSYSYLERERNEKNRKKENKIVGPTLLGRIRPSRNGGLDLEFG
jgi:hypothetical protein